MTPRQQRRLEQKLARKAAKKAPGAASSQRAVLAGAGTPDSREEVAGSARAVAGALNTPPARSKVALPPLSAVQLAANRQNAQLSTGPVTAEGKAIVSQNATRHGLTGKFHVLPNECQQDFDQLLAAFLRDEAPADQEEVQMVQFMAEATWLSRRAVRLQDQAIIAIASGTPEERKEGHKNLALYLRYMTTHDRAYSRYASELRKRRNERARQQRGFVSQQYKEAAEARRQANENRKKEFHELRRETEILRQHRIQRKSERLERNTQAATASEPLAAAA